MCSTLRVCGRYNLVLLLLYCKWPGPTSECTHMQQHPAQAGPSHSLSPPHTQNTIMFK